jgi:DNA-binding NarL/FixJ family response regulator
MLALIVVQHHSLFKSVHALLATVVDSDTLRAADLAEARELMCTRRPDVIVVDGQLPADQVLDLLAEAVRVLPRAKRLIIQAAPEQRAALELGGADLVAFDGDLPERLAAQLERLLAEQRR